MPGILETMNLVNPADALYRDLPSGLAVHPHRLDLLRDLVLLARLSADDFAQASFLDQRAIASGGESAWFEWQQLEERMRGQPAGDAAHYVFHVGHCGSTLVSRLLGDVGITALREPLPLRTLAEIQADLPLPESRWSDATFQSRLALLGDLFDRGRGPRAVKATSFCNDLAAPLLTPRSSRRATVVYARLRPFLANVLAGPNSRLDLLSAAPMRLRRLRARTGLELGRLHEMSPGIVAALTWTTETVSLAATIDALGGERLALVDFDRFLRDVPGALRHLADHVAPGVADARIESAATGPTLTRYSKAPEHAYDARLRQDVLAEGEALFGEELRLGIAWCERAAARAPAIARALDLFDRD